MADRIEHLRLDQVHRGQAVELLGEPLSVGPQGGSIHPGHPGLIDGDDPMHVMISWFGFEEDFASQAVGFNADKTGIFPGLGSLTPSEYSRRCAEITSHRDTTL